MNLIHNGKDEPIADAMLFALCKAYPMYEQLFFLGDNDLFVTDVPPDVKLVELYTFCQAFEAGYRAACAQWACP